MNLALNPFDKGKKPEKVEEVKLDKTLGKVVEGYDDFCCKYDRQMDNLESGADVRIDAGLPALDNKQLQLVIYSLEGDQNFSGSLAGLYLTELIKSAYNKGLKRIELNFSEPVDNLGHSLNAEGLELIVNKAGDHYGACAQNVKFYADSVEHYCGVGAERCEFRVKRAKDNVGRKARFSNFYLYRVGDLCGKKARASTFGIKGMSGANLADKSNNCIYRIYQTPKIGFGDGSNNCTFFLYCGLKEIDISDFGNAQFFVRYRATYNKIKDAISLENSFVEARKQNIEYARKYNDTDVSYRDEDLHIPLWTVEMMKE